MTDDNQIEEPAIDIRVEESNDDRVAETSPKVRCCRRTWLADVNPIMLVVVAIIASKTIDGVTRVLVARAKR